MAQIKCKKCGHHYEPGKNRVGQKEAMLAAGAAGAYYGGGFGIAGGPLGAIAGTVPGAIIGGTAGVFLTSLFSKCPNCREINRN